MKATLFTNLSFRKLGGAAVVSAALSAEINAQSVDSEIVILVDGQTFSQSSFDLVLDGVAQAFEQQSFIDSVAGGPFGSIAASVLVFGSGGTTTQIPWMELSSADELQDFADSVRNISAPPSFGTISYVDAITTGAASIAASAVEGTISQITIVEDGGFFFFSDTEAEIQAARDAALANGVDVINSVVYNAGGREDIIQDYYDTNVVSGGEGGEATVIGGSLFGAPNAAIAEVIEESISESVTQPTVDANNLSAVPEPSAALLVALSGFCLLGRRRR